MFFLTLLTLVFLPCWRLVLHDGTPWAWHSSGHNTSNEHYFEYCDIMNYTTYILGHSVTHIYCCWVYFFLFHTSWKHCRALKEKWVSCHVNERLLDPIWWQRPEVESANDRVKHDYTVKPSATSGRWVCLSVGESFHSVEPTGFYV